MYPVALHRISIQSMDLSQVFGRRILQKQPKIINEITKRWDQNRIKDLEQVCPKQGHGFLS